VLRVKPPRGGAGVAKGLVKMAERWAELQEGLVYSFVAFLAFVFFCRLSPSMLDLMRLQ